MSYNPYQEALPSQQQPRYDLEAAKTKVLIPGIALIAIGTIGLILMGALAFFSVVQIASGAANLDPPPEINEGAERFGFYVGSYGPIVLMVLNSFFQILIIVGGIAMVRAKGMGLAVTGAVLGIIPCVSSSLCLFGIPFGIWAVVVLADPNVKRAFK